MKQLYKTLILNLFIILLAACGSLASTGDSDSECSSNSDCSSYCSFTGTWATNASGSDNNGGFCADGYCYCCYAFSDIDPNTGATSNTYCMTCDEVGTNCNADANYDCYATEDVCLYQY